ncbi:MAG: NAD(P)H-quinone oxidoreductase, partial [Rhodospirillaceae bacterium]|nr:NAD(P)H-quinone oxidoreductase [Rhodospirillaceae bacterium]
MTTFPPTMNAIEITTHGGPEVLKPVTRPVPKPKEGEILVKVAAAGVNRPDLAQRAGAYPPPPGASDLPGLEIAGEVAALGAGVKDISVGDAVCALTPGGGYAEYCATPAAHCLPLPKGYDMVRAAALPETYFTVWTNVFMRGSLLRGETLLVHGGASGIGTTAIQIAVARGAKVIATAGTTEKCRACEDLGALRGINYRDEDFVDIVNEMTKGMGADVILDMVSGHYVPRNQRCLAVDGRMVVIALHGGLNSEVNFGLLMMKRQPLTGS